MIDWNEPIELKIWGWVGKNDKYNHNWKDCEEYSSIITGSRQIRAKEEPFVIYSEICDDGKVMNDGKQIGLVRNKKVEVIRDVGKITGVTFYGGVASIKYEVVRNGVIHRAFDAPHNKHDIVIYYEDLGDKVKITDWAGIRNLTEIHDMGVILEYIKTDERIYGYDNYLDTLSTARGRKAFQKGTVMTWEEFNEVLQHIKKAAENLHNIRKEQKEHKVKKMKAII